MSDGRGLGDLLGGLAGGGGGADLGELLGGLTRSSGGRSMGSLMSALVPTLRDGGLQKVIGELEASGLGDRTASWLGRGANVPISGTEVQHAVGGATLTAIAGRLGVSESEAADDVAEALPQLVDGLSPEGTLPDEDEIDAALRRILGGSG
jgi:uncharacterized protein YidB (DUF937 family)